MVVLLVTLAAVFDFITVAYAMYLDRRRRGLRLVIAGITLYMALTGVSVLLTTPPHPLAQFLVPALGTLFSLHGLETIDDILRAVGRRERKR